MQWLAAICRAMFLLLLGGAILGAQQITNHLSRLEAGVRENAAAASALLGVQKAIRDRNAVLSDMVTVTNRIGAGLDGVQQRGTAIHHQVQAVTAANQSILELNHSLRDDNNAAEQEMRRMHASLLEMRHSTADIRDYMAAMRDTAASDADTLRAISANTARLNARTPGGW